MATTSTGLLANTYTPTTGTAATYDPTQWKVDDRQTVQGQVNNIVAQDSPLMQQAATTAKQQMNGKGLLNTSMAVGAGQNAVISQALPMATQDAATYANSAQYNANSDNASKQFNTGAVNTQTLANQQQQNQFALTNLQQKNSLEQMETQAVLDINKLNTQYGLDTSQKVQLANLNSESAKQLAQIEAQYKNLNQASQSSASIMNTTQAAIARIMEDTSLDATAKQKAIDIYNANAQTSLNIIGSLAGDVDLTEFISSVAGV